MNLIGSLGPLFILSVLVGIFVFVSLVSIAGLFVNGYIPLSVGGCPRRIPGID